MRWSTPKILKSEKGKKNKPPSWLYFTNGNQFNSNPRRKMIIVRLNIFSKTSFLESFCHLGVTKLKALPTANKKDGNTRSVGVNPFHCAWSKG